jgi:NTP pyrophosphatase (non-canonical NTP hydrolase)
MERRIKGSESMRALDDLRCEFGSPDNGPLGLDEYQRCAIQTFRGHSTAVEKLRFLLLGLFGEIGSLLSELKKKQRDLSAYRSYSSSSLEETGDVLWYLANIADQCGLSLSALAGSPNAETAPPAPVRHFQDLQPQEMLFHEPATPSYVQISLLELAGTVGVLVARSRALTVDQALAGDLSKIFAHLVSASVDAQVNLADAAQANLDKVLSRWPLKRNWGKLLDADDHQSEQFPREMRVRFTERCVGSKLFVFQSINDVNIGDRLTDNSAAEDDYRFHDVFHLAFAAILGWSPVLRTLLKVRRISRPEVDEQQDGARAKIAEEGISNWIFAHGLRYQAFEHVDSIDFVLLKTIAQMVKGYEVEACTPWMWEHAILEGFRVFRLLRAHRGGVVIADLERRYLSFEPLT